MRSLAPLGVLAAAIALAGQARAGAPARIADDYPRALAEARREGVPILVEVWAPW